MPSIREITSNRDNKKFTKKEYRSWNTEGNQVKGQILEIEPSKIKNWEYHDRPESELGDIEGLAKEFKEIGQQQPCIVRPLHNSKNFAYELIVGERRWRAANLAKIKLKVIVNDLTDTDAAIIQASENSSREDLSDYAKGMSYSRLIEDKILTQKDLAEKLNISKQQMSRLLSFNKIPVEIIRAIKDMSKISAVTAEMIKQLSSKGQEYIDAIISIAEKLSEGKIGNNKLNEYVESFIEKNKSTKVKHSKKIYGSDGKILFTYKNNEYKQASLLLHKNLLNKLKVKQITIEDFFDNITKTIENEYL